MRASFKHSRTRPIGRHQVAQTSVDQRDEPDDVPAANIVPIEQEHRESPQGSVASHRTTRGARPMTTTVEALLLGEKGCTAHARVYRTSRDSAACQREHSGLMRSDLGLLPARV